MTEETAINTRDILEINPTFLFRWEEKEEAYLMLYPEGIIKLNNTAGEILKLCTGENPVEDIVREIGRKFQNQEPQLETEVCKFLEVSLDKGWIRRAT